MSKITQGVDAVVAIYNKYNQDFTEDTFTEIEELYGNGTIDFETNINDILEVCDAKDVAIYYYMVSEGLNFMMA